jgi:hypothetical protein
VATGSYGHFFHTECSDWWLTPFGVRSRRAHSAGRGLPVCSPSQATGDVAAM